MSQVEGAEDRRDAGPQPALTISDVSKSFAGKLVLTSFNLSIAAGEIHALLGQNGSGKSTLIKVLSGYHLPDSGGSVSVAGQLLEFGSPTVAHRIGCRFVHQDLGLIGTIPVLDNLALGSGYPTSFGTIRQGQALREASEALSKIRLEIDPRRPLSELPPAQQTGVAIARALYSDRVNPPSLLVLDEPTATLPKEEVGNLLETLRAIAATGVGILYVTHHLNEVFQLAHRVTVLRDGLTVGTAPVASIDREKLVHWLVGDVLERADQQIAERIHETGRGVDAPGLMVESLSLGPIKELSLRVRPGEVVGLYGLTGSGRDAILGALFGATTPEAGRIEVAGVSLALGRPHAAIAAGVGYLPPDRKLNGGIMLMSARENLTLLNLKPFWSTWRLRRQPEVAEAKQWFSRVDVRPADAVASPLASFSGGNQQKILFAKWLRQKPRVLLLDEPTQGVDVGAKAELHRQILEAAEGGAAVVVNSTDVEELATLCTRILIIRDGRIADELLGDRLNEGEIDASLHAESAAAETKA